jgi:hypothetical protein
VWASSAAAPATSSAPATGSVDVSGTVKPAPVATGIDQVQLAPESVPGQTVVIVAVVLKQGTKLPAMVQLPVPAGAEATWAGEIIGTDVASDVQRPYRITQGTGGQILEMTVEETVVAQAEFLVSNLSQSGADTSLELNWVQSAPADEAQFSVVLPAGVGDVKITPKPVGQPQFNGAQQALYTLPSAKLKPGESTKIAIAYTKGADVPDTGGSNSSRTTIISILLGGFAIAVAALFFMLRSKRESSE